MKSVVSHIRLSKCRMIFTFVWVLVLSGGSISPQVNNAAAADLQIYYESLAPGWANWSWNTTVNFANAMPDHSGSLSLSATYTGAWAGVYLAVNAQIECGSSGSLSFWIHGGSQGGQKLRIMAADGGYNLIGPGVNVTAVAGSWTLVTVTLAQLGSPSQIGGFVWQDTTGNAQPTFYLDDISFSYSGVTPPPPGPVTGPDLTINVGNNRHPISEDIYGLNFADESLAAELRLPVRRFGGNSTTRYNWRTSMTNTGSDWYYENLTYGNPNTATLPVGSGTDQFVNQDRRTGTKTILTVPLIGWTSKDSSPRNHPYDCGFKVSKYGPQQSVDSWDPDCGNGNHPDGTPIAGNNATDTSMVIGPNFVSSWISHLISRYGAAKNGGVAYYNLDNEPMLWNSTHRDIHPQPTTYEEMKTQTYQFAAAVKQADPSAKTLGPVLWGWCAYFYSAADGCGIGPDYQSHGNTAFVPWYLQQMKAYEQTNGVRILDYLDLHYYPQASGVALSGAGGSTTQALRLRSTRSLWDPAYIDESWISDTQPNGVAVRLIPRMREWVAANYPGTKLAITEYNWGGLDNMNGALAQADVLGIFGREGLDLATLWGPPSATHPGAYAFRMYRNYDAAKSGFGDISVQATSGDQNALSVYAAQQSRDGALTIIVINKSASDLTSNIRLSGFTPQSTADVYQYGASNPTSITHLSAQPVSVTGFSATFPTKSITLFAMKSGTNTGQTLTVNKTGTGAGAVTADAGTIIWNGSAGTASYPTNTTVVLTAAANTGSTFSGWTGCDLTNGNQCAVNMSGPRNVSAAFSMVTPVCTISISPTSKTFSANSGTGSVNVTASASSCQWSAVSNASWITVSAGGSGTGSKTVKYSVARNRSGVSRTGTIAIAGQTFTVTQAK